MVSRTVLGRSLAVIVLLAARPATAGQITLTGNVEADFPERPRIGIVTDNPITNSNLSDWRDVAQADWITARDQVSGWNIQDVRFHYDVDTDKLFVGVNFFGIAGDADGDSQPGHSDPLTQLSGGVDWPGLRGQESIAVALDLNNDRVPDIIAGTPADNRFGPDGEPPDKSTPGHLNGFTVARYKTDNAGLAYAFGETLPNQLGELAFDPSVEHPDYEFTIANFTQVPGLEFDDLPLGFEFSEGIGIRVYAGTPDDIIAGEDTIPYTRIEPQAIPEPATLLGWSALIGFGAWRLRRRRRGSA